MKRGRYFLFAALFAVLTGCATASAPTAKTLNPETGADSISQKIEFKDLPAEMQDAILQGG